MQIQRSDDDGILDYTARLDTYLPVPKVEQLNKGIILERSYTHPDAKNLTTISETNVGDTVLQPDGEKT